MKRTIALLLSALLFIMLLTGCMGSDDTIESLVVANESFSDAGAIGTAVQPEGLSANEPVYASVSLIETPRGMEYTALWYLDDEAIKAETKAADFDARGVMVFELEGEKAASGTLMLQLLYKDTSLQTLVVPIK